MARAIRFIPVVGLALLAMSFGLACKKGAAQDQAKILIIFAGEGAVVQRGPGEIPATLGLILNEADTVRTSHTAVDLQTSSGSTIRVRPFSEMRIRGLLEQHGVDLHLQSGALTAKVRRASQSEEFTVRTPTAIAAVRGTTFTVEENPETGAQVTVIDGKVALAPRVAAAETVSEDSPNAEAIEQLAQAVAVQERVIEAGQAGSLNPQTVEAIQQVNQAVEEQQAAEAPAPIPQEVINQVAQASSQQDAVRVQPAEITLRERAEQESLVSVSAETFEAAAETNDKAAAAEQIQRNYNEERDQALNRIEAEARNSQANSEAEIRQLYRIIEVVTLKDGAKMTGAVMTQIGDVIVVHSAAGVRRVPTSNIQYIDFQDAR